MITCQFENGNKGELRHVTINGIIIKDGKILLGKRGSFQGKPLLESGKWGLIGGFMDRDENLEQALRREVQEETGWTIKHPVLFHIKDNPDRPGEKRQNVEFVFIAEAIQREGVGDEEVTQLEWFSLDTIPPTEMIAFDHAADLQLYKQYLIEKFTLPIVGKNKNMENKLRCQSCGMPLGEGFFGSNNDGSINKEYCSFCFQKGIFTKPDLTIEQMIQMSVENMTQELKMPPDKARELATSYIPQLKRWKK